MTKITINGDELTAGEINTIKAGIVALQWALAHPDTPKELQARQHLKNITEIKQLMGDY